ncbi:MAG: tRNA (adenosine(37)-N6)-dimethylallyltransferase MiaA [Patescibacteria group bacterium]
MSPVRPISPIKVVVIVGPTSSGKSELAVKLAKKFNGEIISADSRQIYKGMNIGTGKVPGRWHTTHMRGRAFKQYFYKDIRHHLIDFVNPKTQYSAALFQRDAGKIIVDISKRGKLPILCGGTGHWIDIVVYDRQIPDIKPNPTLRKKLEKLSTVRLFERIRERDPERARTIDKHNKRRLTRALEIILTTGKPVPPNSVIPSDPPAGGESRDPLYNAHWIGLKIPQKPLYQKIDLRLKHRLKAGMVNEVKQLRKQGLSWRRLEQFGLEYRYISQYLLASPHPLPTDGERVREGWNEMIQKLSYAIKHYAKRQLTWWKRNKEINWIKPHTKIASRVVSKFLNHAS